MILAISSKKGGVGKTTSAVSLAGALCEKGKSVLVIDFDPQASASISLGVDFAELAPSIADVLLRNLPAARAIRPTPTPRLDLITASADLAALEPEAGFVRSEELQLSRCLQAVSSDYDVVLIDCPPAFSLLTRNAVAAADAYIIPTVPQFLAVAGIEQLMEAVDRLRRRCQTSTRLLGVLPTLVDSRASSTNTTLETIRQRLGDQIFEAEIPVNVRLAEAPRSGKTIFGYDPESAGARAYRRAADELMVRMAGPPAPLAVGATEQGPRPVAGHGLTPSV